VKHQLLLLNPKRKPKGKRMAFAIIRVAKVKSLGSLSGLSRHHIRAAMTPNADPNAPETIRVLVGGANPYQEVKARLPEKVRKNGVLAMEHLLTASPEYFRPSDPSKSGTYDIARMEAWAAKAVLHLDESTPHIHAIVVPKRADGKLDAAKLFGPEQLRNLQDDYAEKMKPLGLQRGIEGSRAKHERIKTFYGRVNTPAPVLPEVSTPKTVLRERKLIERIPFTNAKARYDAVELRAKALAEKRQQEVEERQRAIEEALPALLAKSAVVDMRQKADKSREKTLSELRAQASIVREIPLDKVLERLGCTRDPADPKNNWKTPAGRITVTGQKFFNHDMNKGGGGAIDLVMMQLSVDYKGAVAWLSGEFGKGAAVGAAMAAAKVDAVQSIQTIKPPSTIPTPSQDPSHIKRVRDYLVFTRKISGWLVDSLIEKGKVFAATWTTKNGATITNAAFVLDTDGVELRGLSDSHFHGVRGKKGAFIISAPNAKKSVFVESAIEAMSYYMIARERGESVRVISTTGSSSEKLEEMVKQEVQAGHEIVAAFNNDRTGDKLSVTVEKAGGTREVPPLGCNDWNEYLQIRDKLEKPTNTKVHNTKVQSMQHFKNP
jgi:hypothetical protein